MGSLIVSDVSNKFFFVLFRRLGFNMLNAAKLVEDLFNFVLRFYQTSHCSRFFYADSLGLGLACVDVTDKSFSWWLFYIIVPGIYIII